MSPLLPFSSVLLLRFDFSGLLLVLLLLALPVRVGLGRYVGAALLGLFVDFVRDSFFVGVIERWLGALADDVVFVLFEANGEEEIRSVNRPWGFSSSSSSDEMTTVRFRRFAGGAMAAKGGELSS